MSPFVRFHQSVEHQGVLFLEDNGSEETRYLIRTYTDTHLFVCCRPNDRYTSSCVSFALSLEGRLFTRTREVWGEMSK